MVKVNGKKIRSNNELYCFDTLQEVGMIRVYSVGQENVYFEFTCDLGHTHKGYCKCL